MQKTTVATGIVAIPGAQVAAGTAPLFSLSAPGTFEVPSATKWIGR